MASLTVTLDFNPRSREGSDLNTFNKTGQSGDFNPRSREGSDFDADWEETGTEYISIHAPARGATDLTPELRAMAKFQSTLPRGERRNVRRRCWRLYRYFNPRSREGSDWEVKNADTKQKNFNPRSREGSDQDTA